MPGYLHITPNHSRLVFAGGSGVKTSGNLPTQEFDSNFELRQ
jgi:hypothetical protein